MNYEELTKQNRDALPIYKEACAILDLPLPQRKARIELHPQSQRLAKEVIRIYAWRKEQKKKETTHEQHHSHE